MISPVRMGGLEFELALCISHSPFSSPYLSSGQIFIRPAQCLTWQGSMDITCRGCSEATGLAWWGQILSHGPSSTLTAPIKCKTGIVADENVYLTAHVYPLSLPLFCVFFLHDVLMSVDVRMVRESWEISKIGLFYYVNLLFLWQSVGRLWLLW